MKPQALLQELEGAAELPAGGNLVVEISDADPYAAQDALEGVAEVASVKVSAAPPSTSSTATSTLESANGHIMP